jgi:CheY-like chemotaxis protein
MKGDSADFVYVNEAASRSLGYSRQELMSGMGVLDIDPGLNRAAWTEMMRTMKDIRQARVESTHRSRYGYRVLEAETAATALDVFRMRGDEVALLTDLVMPGTMSGRHLAEKLVAERPKLKVLFTSGYSPDVVNRLLHFAPGQLLQKPYTAAVLATTVRRCLDATP